MMVIAKHIFIWNLRIITRLTNLSRIHRIMVHLIITRMVVENSAFAVIPIKPKDYKDDNGVLLVQDTRNGSLANLSFYNPVIENP